MIEKLNKDRLIELMLLANTPYYLIRNYLEDDSIRILSATTSSKDIIEKIKELRSKATSIENVVTIFALIISLMIKGDRESELFLQKIGDYNIQWGSYFANYYFSKKRPQIVRSINLDYKLPQHNKNYNASNIMTTFDEFKNKPQIKVL